jgi:Protein of unknown function (DUF3040)
MALSEYEQRKLKEIERSLNSDDPALATILDSGVVRHLGRVIAVLSLPAVGIVLSVLGFVAMGVGAGLYVSGRAGDGHPAAARPGAGYPAALSWRTRLEERFQARFGDPGK